MPKTATDTRTRLYYTAKFSDNFQFVNKFEFNTMWGDNNGGDLAADGKGNWRIKSSYVDFTLGNVQRQGWYPGCCYRSWFCLLPTISPVLCATVDLGMVTIPVLYAMGANQDEYELGMVMVQVKWVSSPMMSNTVLVTFGSGNADVHLLSTMPQIKVSDSVTDYTSCHLGYRN